MISYNIETDKLEAVDYLPSSLKAGLLKAVKDKLVFPYVIQVTIASESSKKAIVTSRDASYNVYDVVITYE